MSDKNIWNVIQLKPNGEPRKYRVIKGGGCKHNGKLINEEKRTVECARCGAPLDAFDALLKIAINHEYEERESEMLERKTKALRSQLEALEAVEKKIKARLRNKGVVLDPRWGNDPKPFVVHAVAPYTVHVKLISQDNEMNAYCAADLSKALLEEARKAMAMKEGA